MKMSKMKKVSFLTLMILFACGFSAFAQEEQFPAPQEQIPEVRPQETNPSKETGMPMWEMDRIQREPGNRVENTTVKRSEPVVNTTKERETPSRPKATQEKDESVLSFNFLYYLVQKFKLSETVEK
ncbi:hypothetical protein [Fulvivirga sedimenti]|uniref:Uncharacterized protein n=1 Tax=Fulvivirga sedimenti TaxID=2879465 RepID=A0A9X1HV40_9BACT|nr:hypothetical protein [Fulvivirga sedimenti]MCA6078456.1 hypothetical protein [Fulvivirga sedimenti]